MQISRHWRLNAQRYRLQGVRHQDGSVSLQGRPVPVNNIQQDEQQVSPVDQVVTNRSQRVMS